MWRMITICPHCREPLEPPARERLAALIAAGPVTAKEAAAVLHVSNSRVRQIAEAEGWVFAKPSRTHK